MDLLSELSKKIKKMIKKRKPGEISKSYMKKFISKRPIIIEAGAHIGTDTVEMANCWPSGKIYAFEPIPHLFSILKENTRHLNNVECFPIALSNKNGFSYMHISSGSSDGSSSLLAPKEHLRMHPDVKFKDQTKVQTMTLDNWAEKNFINKIDFLWLDLQGHELAVLMASPKTMRNVKAVYTEVNLIENYSGNALYSEMRSWMESYGFIIKCEALAWLDGGNVFFCKT